MLSVGNLVVASRSRPIDSLIEETHRSPSLRRAVFPMRKRCARGRPAVRRRNFPGSCRLFFEPHTVGGKDEPRSAGSRVPMEDVIVDRSDGESSRLPGDLVTFLGTAPGVGKTYRMLTEGQRRAQANENVVIGWVERHERAGTGDQALPFVVVPPRTVMYRGSA